MSKKCKGCGTTCAICVRCDHCGKCQSCGKPVVDVAPQPIFPINPIYPIYPQPNTLPGRFDPRFTGPLYVGDVPPYAPSVTCTTTTPNLVG